MTNYCVYYKEIDIADRPAEEEITKITSVDVKGEIFTFTDGTRILAMKAEEVVSED